MDEMLMRLHHVQIAMPTGKEDEARTFYRDVLGMSEIDKPTELQARGGAWFRSGGLELHLGIEVEFQPARKAHPGILVASVQALAERLNSHGTAVTWDSNFPEYKRFHCFDCFGNRLEFLEPVLTAD